jgi:hypothetical protein
MIKDKLSKELTELRRKIKNDYPGRECALTRKEWQLEKLVDSIRQEQSGLLCIGILKRGFKWIYKEDRGITLNEATDTHIGKIGTPKREKFEAELKEELEKTTLLVSVNKIRHEQTKKSNKERE